MPGPLRGGGGGAGIIGGVGSNLQGLMESVLEKEAEALVFEATKQERRPTVVLYITSVR